MIIFQIMHGLPIIEPTLQHFFKNYSKHMVLLFSLVNGSQIEYIYLIYINKENFKF